MQLIRGRHRLTGIVAALLLLAGLWQMGSGTFIHAKALLARHLISAAWEESLARGAPVKPWSWADTWPVARLQWQDSVDLLVLSGISGASLPFGPGLENPPGTKTLIVAGHRDTHFGFLGAARIGDRLRFTDMQGVTRVYRVLEKELVDTRTTPLAADPALSQLILVTCFPLDALRAGGPLRLVIRGVLEERPAAGGLRRVSFPDDARPALPAGHK